MPKPNQHVVPNRGGWSVRSSGSKRASRNFDTREEAIDLAWKMANKFGTEVYIHGRDGRIREHGSDGRIRERSSFGS